STLLGPWQLRSAAGAEAAASVRATAAINPGNACIRQKNVPGGGRIAPSQICDALLDLVDDVVGRRRAGGEADAVHAAEPVGVEVVRPLHEVRRLGLAA